MQRNINDNSYTNNAWSDNGDNIPDYNEIDYSKIFNFTDQEIGLLLSYNKFLNKNSIIGINIKPNYHSIGINNALGLSFDIKYFQSINSHKIIFGLNDLLSYKKWDYGYEESFETVIFINYSYKLKDLLFIIEYDNYLNLKAGFEYQINDKFTFQLGSNDSNVSLGFGFISKLVDVNYAYLHNNTIDFDQSHKIGFLFKINNN